MTRQYIYAQIVGLTTSIAKVGVADKIFNAAKTGDTEKVREVFDEFKKGHFELHQEITNFSSLFCEHINAGLEGAVFGSEEDKEKGIFKFDISGINASALYVLTFFGDFDEFDFFINWPEDANGFLESISRDTCDSLSKFIEGESWRDVLFANEDYTTLYDLLVDIFSEK